MVVSGESGSSGVINDGMSNDFVVKDLVFVGKGNPHPSKYIVVPKELENNMKSFAEFLLKGLRQDSADANTSGGFLPSKPSVLISVTAGVQHTHSSNLERVIIRGLLQAAQNISAWIVDGGLDTGVAQYVGRFINEMAMDNVPCIGIAPYRMVLHHDELSAQLAERGAVEYVANGYNALNPYHTHFILVDGPRGWGVEIEFRSQLEEYLRDKFDIPVVLIAVNGGPGTLDTVAQGVVKKFAVVVVEGSGRASDAIAALLRKAQVCTLRDSKAVLTCETLMAIDDDGVDASPWVQMLAQARGDASKIATWTAYMDKILQNRTAVTVFNANDEASADMDVYILRAILCSPGKKLSVPEKLKLGVIWNRGDVITEILDEAKYILSSEDQQRGINEALELSLQLDRPEIFTILVENGAQKDQVSLARLYFYKPVKHYFKRIPAYTQTKIPKSMQSSTESMEGEYTESMKRPLKEVFDSVGHAFRIYYYYLDAKLDKYTLDAEGNLIESDGTMREKKRKTASFEDPEISFIDFLFWAIFVNRFALAKAIWRKTTLPVHSALLACQLYNYLSYHSDDEEAYIKSSDWFEQEAIKVLDKLDYKVAKDVLVWEYTKMGGKTAMDIAKDACCKKFVCHAHVQTLLDGMFYANGEIKIDRRTSFAKILLSIFFPFLIISNSSELHNSYGYYFLPVVKFWTNVLFYCGFLFVQAWSLVNVRSSQDFLVSEYILWVWVFALIVDEFKQFRRDSANYFNYLSNQLDILLLLLHVAYMVLRWTAHAIDSDLEPVGSASVDVVPADHYSRAYSAAINILIVACIFSWARLLNVFAINHKLGTLSFVIKELFNDVFLWVCLFLIFAVSFQLGFANISVQAGADPAATYPSGTLPVSFFTIIGDYNYINEIFAATPLGITLLAIYALIAQVMLVNLLIAMMGNTYNNMSNNSVEEWKFYRLKLIMENQTASFNPPPFNLITLSIEIILWCHKKANKLRARRSVVSEEGDEVLVPRHKEVLRGSKDFRNSSYVADEEREVQNFQMVLKRMRLARDKVIKEEQEEENNSDIAIMTGLKKRLRTLAIERENDRAFLEKRFEKLTAAPKVDPALGAGAGAGAGASAEVTELREMVAALHASNQQILALMLAQQPPRPQPAE